jgi:hypothetical protein
MSFEGIMAVLKFDKTKNHATVFPPEGKTEASPVKAHFFQAGFYFDQNGDLIEDMLDEVARKRLQNAEARAEADRKAEEARRKSLEEQGIKGAELEEALKPPVVEKGNEPEIDILAWARGQKKYITAKVFAAAQKKYNYVAMDKDQLIDWLVDNGHLKVTEINVA